MGLRGRQEAAVPDHSALFLLAQQARLLFINRTRFVVRQYAALCVMALGWLGLGFLNLSSSMFALFFGWALSRVIKTDDHPMKQVLEALRPVVANTANADGSSQCRACTRPAGRHSDRRS